MEPETVPDVAGDDITAASLKIVELAGEGLPEDDRELSVEEKLDVLAGVIEYQDEQIAEIKTACARMAQVVIRLMQAVDAAAGNQSAVIGPDGAPLSRKQRRDIQFGRGQ